MMSGLPFSLSFLVKLHSTIDSTPYTYMVKSGYSISSAIIEHYYPLRNLLSVIKDFKPRLEKLRLYRRLGKYQPPVYKWSPNLS